METTSIETGGYDTDLQELCFSDLKRPEHIKKEKEYDDIDQITNNPELLKEYREKYKPDPERVKNNPRMLTKEGLRNILEKIR